MMGEEDGKHHGSFGDKFKHPFHELKEKLHNTHLHDAKVHLTHQKQVPTWTA
jgi:phospholipase D1/2